MIVWWVFLLALLPVWLALLSLVKQLLRLQKLNDSWSEKYFELLQEYKLLETGTIINKQLSQMVDVEPEPEEPVQINEYMG